MIGNAIKFRSSRPPHVTIGAALEKGLWLFQIGDNGIGLDMNYNERIFQMFQRLHERGKYDGEDLRKLPIVVFTSSNAEYDLVQSYALGANCCVTKSVDLKAFQHNVQAIRDFWFSVAQLP